MKKLFLKFNIKTFVTILLAGTLYGVIGFFGFPIGSDIYIKPGVAFLAIIGAAFGPITGFLVGLIGHTITDVIGGWGIWWGWIMSSAIMGCFMGLIYTYNNFNIKEDKIKTKHIVYMVLSGSIGIVFALLAAGVYDVYVMKEPFIKIKAQVISAIVSNLLVLWILGIPSVWGLSKINKE